MADVREARPPKGPGGRDRPLPNPFTDLGWCYKCMELVKKGTPWTLKVRAGASRLYCSRCK